MKRCLLLCLLVIQSFIVSAQYLVESELVESLTASFIFANFGIPASNDVDSYRVTYNTIDATGNDVVASGLITVPKNPAKIFPLLAVQHGTVSSRWEVPSQLSGGYQLGMIPASLGYITVQADLIGLGESPGIHPYVHGRSEATAARDLMRAAREFADMDADISMNDQVFISGYSQGGHGALALHKLLELEHNDEFLVTASSPMSGPYSISEEMINFTLGDNEYDFCAYLAWTALSMKTAYPTELADYDIDDIFKPQYVNPINNFAAELIDLNQLNSAIKSELLKDVGRITPKDMLYPDILEALKNDPTHPLSIALEDNDLDDWAPNAPTRLMYCTGDDQVTYTNAITAEQKMNALGAYDLLAVENGETLDHGGCVTPALTSTIVFFLDYREISDVSSLNDLGMAYQKMRTVQNSGELEFILDTQLDFDSHAELLLYSMNGALLSKTPVSAHRGSIDISGLTPTMYVLGLRIDSRIVQLKKVFIH